MTTNRILGDTGNTFGNKKGILSIAEKEWMQEIMIYILFSLTSIEVIFKTFHSIILWIFKINEPIKYWKWSLEFSNFKYRIKWLLKLRGGTYNSIVRRWDIWILNASFKNTKIYKPVKLQKSWLLYFTVTIWIRVTNLFYVC